jgi:hypothetical protein
VIKWMPGYTDPLDPVPDQDDHPAWSVNGTTSVNGTAAELDGVAEDVDGATGEPDGAAGGLDIPAPPGRDDPDDAKAGAASPNG